MPGKERDLTVAPVNTYAALLDATMRAQRLGPGEVARRSGVHRATIYAALKGEPMGQPPEDETIRRLAGALGINETRLRWTVAQSLGLVGELDEGATIDLTGLDKDSVEMVRLLVGALRRGTQETEVRIARSGTRLEEPDEDEDLVSEPPARLRRVARQGGEETQDPPVGGA